MIKFNFFVRTKKCTRCGKYHTLDNFYKDASSNDGLSHWCTACRYKKYASTVSKENTQLKKQIRKTAVKKQLKKVSKSFK